MKKRFRKLLSLVLALCLCLSLVPTSFAEEEAEEAPAIVSEALQVVDIAPEKQDKLEESETAYYQEKVDALSDGSRESVTVETDEKTLVYTLKESGTEEKVLQEYEYASTDGAGLSLQTYSEIHLKGTQAETTPEAAPETAPEAAPEAAQETAQEVAPEAAPETDTEDRQVQPESKEEADSHEETVDIENNGDAENPKADEAAEPVSAEDEEEDLTREDADFGNDEADVKEEPAEEHVEEFDEDVDEEAEEEAEVDEDAEPVSDEDKEEDLTQEEDIDPEYSEHDEEDPSREEEDFGSEEEDSEEEYVEEFDEDTDEDAEIHEDAEPVSDENEEENLTQEEDIDPEYGEYDEEDPAQEEDIDPEYGEYGEEDPAQEEDIDPEYGEYDKEDPGCVEEDSGEAAEVNADEKSEPGEDEVPESEKKDEENVETVSAKGEADINANANTEADASAEAADETDTGAAAGTDSETDAEAAAETDSEADNDTAVEADADPKADTAAEGDNSYVSEEEVLVTAEELLNRILAGDEMAIAFANSLGFGRTVDEQAENLTLIVDEYRAHPEFVEPSFLIRDVRLTLDREITQETQDVLDGYRTTVSVDSSATVEIRYDERGEAKVTRRVPTDKPTDFVITLDVSGSMNNGGVGKDNAMFSALRVVLDEILASPENTVSIIFWANNAALMRLDVDGDGMTETSFSGADGYTAELIYDHPLISENGTASSIVLSESYNVISKIENLYGTWSGTEPDQGLDQAIALLEAMTRDEGRNLGVLFFTDGAANYESSEHRTVANEQELAERFNAKIVNVSIGDENAVRKYERYLDPDSDRYYEPDNDVLHDRVLYYNIPTVSNEELAERVTEMFDIAFQDIMSETRKLTSETVTAGILAAVSARVIETVPAGFQVVTTDGHNYTVEGTDEDGNTVISFTLDNLVSGNTTSVSYFVVPTSADTDIGLTAYTAEAGTTLFAEPIDRIQHPEEDREVQIVYSSNGSSSAQLRPDRRHPERHSKFYDYDGNDAGHISAADEQRLINQFVQKMLEAGINWELIGECVDYLDDTDDEKMKEMWLTMFSSPDLLDIRTLAAGSYQNQDGTQIFVNLDISSPYFMPRTVFHEIGHAVDNMTGRLQANTQSRQYYTNSRGRADGIADDVWAHVQDQAAAKVDAYIQGLQYTAWAFGDDSDLTQAQQSRDQLIGYLTDRIMYNNIPWMYEDGAASEADLEQRLVARYFGGEQPGFVDADQLVSDIRADFTDRRPDLLNCTDLPSGTAWRDAYKQCISDVYGGVTNKYLDDGSWHSEGYWYDKHSGDRIDIRMTAEPWAEYSEARLMNTPNALDVVNEFLPSYHFEETEDEMYRLMMNYLDQHGIQEPTAA